MEWENKARSLMDLWHPTSFPDLAFGIGALKFSVLKASVQQVAVQESGNAFLGYPCKQGHWNIHSLTQYDHWFKFKESA